MGDHITADLIPPTLFHAASQGALAEIRADDQETQALCQMLIHQETQWKCLTERALELEGGCSIPVGVYTSLSQVNKSGVQPTSATLTITGRVTSIDGSVHI
jgi:hydroxymethylbilane synthase